MTEREVSTAELAEDVKNLTAAVERFNDTIEKLTERIEGTYLRKDVYEIAHSQLVTQVAAMDGRLSWASRAAITGVLFPIVAGIVAVLIVSVP
jgi:hypothetical protein